MNIQRNNPKFSYLFFQGKIFSLIFNTKNSPHVFTSLFREKSLKCYFKIEEFPQILTFSVQKNLISWFFTNKNFFKFWNPYFLQNVPLGTLPHFFSWKLSTLFSKQNQPPGTPLFFMKFFQPYFQKKSTWKSFNLFSKQNHPLETLPPFFMKTFESYFLNRINSLGHSPFFSWKHLTPLF